MSNPPDLPPQAPSPAAPPTEPGRIPLRPSGPAWPLVLGIICVIVGALGTLSNAWGALSPLFLGAMSRMAGPGGASIAAIQRHVPLMVCHALVSAALSVALLAGGVALLTRRRWSRGVLLTWAVLKFLVVPAGAAVTYVMQQAQFKAMQEDPQFSGGAAAAAMGGVAAAMVAFTVAWGWALPVFMAIWLMRKPVRAHVASWGERPPP